VMSVSQARRMTNLCPRNRVRYTGTIFSKNNSPSSTSKSLCLRRLLEPPDDRRRRDIRCARAAQGPGHGGS
jgi:hypothetical protein